MSASHACLVKSKKSPLHSPHTSQVTHYPPCLQATVTEIWRIASENEPLLIPSNHVPLGHAQQSRLAAAASCAGRKEAGDVRLVNFPGPHLALRRREGNSLCNTKEVNIRSLPSVPTHLDRCQNHASSALLPCARAGSP